MLELPPKAFLSPEFAIKAADAAWEFQGAAHVRREVFCQEQCIFEDDDLDAIDDVALPLVAISTIAGQHDQVVGTVRIHEEKPFVWWGSRLAVLASHRRVGRLGAELIRLAVCTANARGCETFFAHVQTQNVKLFERLNWKALELVTLHGQPHMKMQADLESYPPFATPKIGWRAPLRGKRRSS